MVVVDGGGWGFRGGFYGLHINYAQSVSDINDCFGLLQRQRRGRGRSSRAPLQGTSA